MIVLCVPGGFGCSAPVSPEDLSREFSAWFVTPTHERRETLLKRRDPSLAWNALARAIRNESGMHGAFATTMTDTFGAEYTLGCCTPDHFRKDTLLPLIIYLHGGLGANRSDKGARAYEMLSPLRDSCDMFLASPSANMTAPWWSAAGLSRIMQTLRYMTLHFPIDPDRVFLCGVSDGVTGCFAAANTIAAPFAGFIAISGFGGMLPQLGMPLIPEHLMQRPIYVIHAGRDRLYPLAQVERFLDDLSAQGVSITRSIHPNEEHGFDYKARELGNLAAILRTWVRPSGRTGFSRMFARDFPNAPENIVAWEYADRAGGAAQAVGYWRDDTLVCMVTGLSRLVVIAPGPASRKRFARVNDSRLRPMRSRTVNQRMLFDYLPRTGFPTFNAFTISSCTIRER